MFYSKTVLNLRIIFR